MILATRNPIEPIVGENGVPYVNTDNIIGKRTSEAPWTKSKSGYGCKLPTSFELQLTDKRWRRVYVVCYSNSGTVYILVKGRPQYLMSNFDFEP